MLLKGEFAKIALCTDSFLPVIDGVGRVVNEYAKRLSSKGHECYVITPYKDFGFRGNLPFELIDFLSIPVPSANQYRTGLANLDARYMEHIKNVDFDLIHAHSPSTSGIEATRLANKLNIPMVGTFHSKYYDDFKRYTNSNFLSHIGKKYVVSFYENCTEVWTVSNNAAETLVSYGFSGHPKIVRNGSLVQSKNSMWETLARKKYNLDSTPILMYVGQIDKKKNIFKIIDATEILKDRGYKFQLLFVGQGKDESALNKMIIKKGLESFFHFTGHIYDPMLLNGLYMAASLFVFPSLYDTAGLVVNEAAMMGTPSLVSEGSASSELINHGINGLICADDALSICDSIQDFLYCKTEHEQTIIGESAMNTLPIPWDTIIDGVEKGYEMLLKNFKEYSSLQQPKL